MRIPHIMFTQMGETAIDLSQIFDVVAELIPALSELGYRTFAPNIDFLDIKKGDYKDIYKLESYCQLNNISLETPLDRTIANVAFKNYTTVKKARKIVAKEQISADPLFESLWAEREKCNNLLTKLNEYQIKIEVNGDPGDHEIRKFGIYNSFEGNFEKILSSERSVFFNIAYGDNSRFRIEYVSKNSGTKSFRVESEEDISQTISNFVVDLIQKCEYDEKVQLNDEKQALPPQGFLPEAVTPKKSNKKKQKQKKNDKKNEYDEKVQLNDEKQALPSQDFLPEAIALKKVIKKKPQKKNSKKNEKKNGKEKEAALIAEYGPTIRYEKVPKGNSPLLEELPHPPIYQQVISKQLPSWYDKEVADKLPPPMYPMGSPPKYDEVNNEDIAENEGADLVGQGPRR